MYFEIEMSVPYCFIKATQRDIVPLHSERSTCRQQLLSDHDQKPLI